MFRLIRIFAFAALLASGASTLAGCAGHAPRTPASELPTLRLSPASLGRELALQQRLQIVVGEQSQTLEALLEVDARELRLGVQAMGQSALTLRWDGKNLQQQRADWLPPALSADRVLFDLQLVLWPADAIRAALPSNWSLQESDGKRQLMLDGNEIVSVTYVSPDHSVLKQLNGAYQLDVTSTPVAEVTQ